MDRKTCNELRAYLANIAEQCSAAAAGEEAALPSVVVLDNLQHASALGDAFAGLLPPDNRNMPVIIGKYNTFSLGPYQLKLSRLSIIMSICHRLYNLSRLSYFNANSYTN